MADSRERALQVFDRTVKPRKRTYQPLPIIAVGQDRFLAESGETGSIGQLIDELPSYPSTLFCTVGSSADFVGMLSSHYILPHNGTWTWRVHDSAKRAINVRSMRMSTVVNYFGWQGKDHNKGVYHRVIDPVTFSGHRIETVWPNGPATDDPAMDQIRKVLAWAVAVRDFCAANNLEVRPTQGSVAAQFLIDPRFYPEARRKVPAAINERARENLPGNHYHLNVVPDPSNNFTAHYLDQHCAHHYAARNTPLPDSNHCFAFGNYLTLERSPVLRVEPHFFGLYCLDLSAPQIRPPFDWLGNGLAERIGDTLEKQFVFSNELPHLMDMGYRVHSVRAAWGSRKRDTGLARYAQWAEEQLDAYGAAAWLKPVLLATYGVLATRPDNRSSIFRLAQKGEPVRLRTGRHELNGRLVQTTRKLEPGVAHVIQRGMIEAATRSESIGFAQWLDHLGHKVLSIYADAVIVEADDDNPLPELIDPWRLKRTLNHLQFINTQAFQSDGMTKMPGVNRDGVAYRQQTMPGYAPRKQQTDLLTGKRVTTSRRI